MTLRLVVSPVYRIECDGIGCDHTFIANEPWGRCDDYAARRSARDHGWYVRPTRGQGSRSAPDLCPACKPAEAKP